MQSSPFHRFSELKIKEIAPGFFSSLIHTSSNTINFIEVKAGCALPLHQHVHEQYTFVLSGQFELTIETETVVLDPQQYALIPGNARHGGKAVTDCKLLDIFSPVREDYR